MKEEHRRIRIFENPILEFTTHVHPMVPLLLWGPVVTALITRSILVLKISYPLLGVLAIGGLITWTLLEYIFHRFLFHMKVTSALQKRLQFLMHGLHHEDPKDPTRLVMPPVPAIILASVCWFLIRSCLGPIYAQPFFAFFLTGYLAYDYLHFYMHFVTPKNTVGKWLRNHHFKHHFATPDARWGVSSPLWDYVFRTNHELKVARMSTSNETNSITSSQLVTGHTLASEKTPHLAQRIENIR